MLLYDLKKPCRWRLQPATGRLALHDRLAWRKNQCVSRASADPLKCRQIRELDIMFTIVEFGPIQGTGTAVEVSQLLCRERRRGQPVCGQAFAFAMVQATYSIHAGAVWSDRWQLCRNRELSGSLPIACKAC
ncbi:hypothetical protein [Massilia niabensis]|uniref:Uncharacterized protein n=1 Tax=Massilia niabensis TaxID=544910 RepID=A0ABW0LAX0_9BURK